MKDSPGQRSVRLSPEMPRHGKCSRTFENTIIRFTMPGLL
jgi:hypothetical protein